MSQSIIGCVNKPPHTYLYIKYPVGAFLFFFLTWPISHQYYHYNIIQHQIDQF